MASSSGQLSTDDPQQTKPPATTAEDDSPQVGSTTAAQPTTGESTTVTTAIPAIPATPATPAAVPTETATTSAPTTPAAATSPAAAEGAETADQSDVLPPSHWQPIPQQAQEEEEFDDVDSAYGDDNASSTASLSASILEYRTVHGRTYHSERGNAQSWNPNDAQHDESMDILHHVSTLMQDGRLTMAYIDDSVQKVLDVGCGTGIWAIDFADQYPHTEVVGVDISPSQPQWIPPNLKFEIDDITQPWTYPRSSFDYIHMRWLIGAIPDWYMVFREIFQTLRPGGIFESKESSCVIQSDDGTVPYGSALDQWGRVFSEAGRKFGRTFRPLEEELQLKAMQAAGFIDIKVYNMKTTLGPWPADPKHKEIGQYARLALEQDIEGFIMYMWTTVLGWTREEIAVYAAHLRRELRSPQYHAYYPQRVVVGRKPY
ncbi:S-adenosyl-L-methionine-dependent methyltransferase [Xylaria bambusicola]|uniref:S-adenosyl-L-methionine-dependent methyltransferase n=1 Tax=Xylaria bambusicola TaxID=326684 RepID=UPI002008678E|nr:S-adenosyl-L-methionine-dependent methyltransferase [Xylaria bambusicola]KAI0506693.1 S-adenosyl-L-methionine-dependent methyltransferase [Xylaria bambusicola]